MKTRPEKTCAVCGRTMQWRKRWARDWEHVRYCSRACRRKKIQPIDRALEEAILALLRARTRKATIAPRDAARAVRPDDVAGSWRALLEPARNAARRLAARGLVEIIQDGRVVDPSSARGTLKLRLVRSF